MVGRHSSIPVSGLAEKSSREWLRNNFSWSVGCQSHSRRVRKFFREMIFAPSSGTTASSTSSLPITCAAKPWIILMAECLADIIVMFSLSTSGYFPQQIGGQRVIWIAPQDTPQKRVGFCFFFKAKLRLRLEKESRRCLAKLQVIIKQQHRRQGCGEIVNLRRGLFQPPRKVVQFAKKFLRLCALAELFPRQRREISHFGKRTNAHLLKIAFEVCSGVPVFTSLCFFADVGKSATEPVMNVTLVGQQVLGFAKILRGGQRLLEMQPGRIKISLLHCRAAQRELGANVLAEWTAFTTFPRLKPPAGKILRGFFGPADLVVERASFDR